MPFKSFVSSVELDKESHIITQQTNLQSGRGYQTIKADKLIL
jgi:hypothetical protein